MKSVQKLAIYMILQFVPRIHLTKVNLWRLNTRQSTQTGEPRLKGDSPYYTRFIGKVNGKLDAAMDEELSVTLLMSKGLANICLPAHGQPMEPAELLW
jgi:hypothetical protein